MPPLIDIVSDRKALAQDLLREAEAQRALAEMFPHLKGEAMRAIQDLFPLRAQAHFAPAQHLPLRR